MSNKITQSELKSVVSYDPETGIFVRIATTSLSAKIGEPIGTVATNGRVYISVMGISYMAHHLAWLFMTGEWPSANVAFSDGNYLNLRFNNLKEESFRETALRAKSKSDTPGVTWDSKRQKWFAKITVGYKQKALGRYVNKDDAVAAVKEALAKAAEGDHSVDEFRKNRALQDRRNAYLWDRAQELSNGPMGWGSIDEFVLSIGERPSDRHRLQPKNEAIPMGPDNFEWMLPRFSFGTREGRREYEVTFRKENPDILRDRELRKNFGISFERYMEMSTEQNHVCAICSQPETDKRANGETRLLAVDHNHTTDAVRGLLCGACNKAIGYMCEDVTRLKAAVDYLEKYNGKSNVVHVEFARDPLSGATLSFGT